MRINNNISALNAWRGLTNTDNALSKSLEKLSSGQRINRAGDDAAGLAISEKMRGQIRGLDMAIKNAQDGISLIQTAEGALTESHAILQRMRELAVQSSNDTNTTEDRLELQKELNQLIEELNRISDNTEFNTQKLLDGSFANKIIHIGANTGQAMKIDITSMHSSQMGKGVGYAEEVSFALDAAFKHFVQVGDGTEIDLSIAADAHTDNAGFLADINDKLAGTGIAAKLNEAGNGVVLESMKEFSHGDTSGSLSKATSTTDFGLNISALQLDIESAQSGGILTQADADLAIAYINNAIETVSGERSKLGAFQNRLEHTIKNLGVASENLSAAESRIRDVDMAAEMMNFTKQNILMQAGTAMLAQANARPQSVLQLLG